MSFTANNKYLIGGTDNDVRVWRVKDGKEVATIPVGVMVRSVAASKDGRWIAGGSQEGHVWVWDTTIYNIQVFAERIGDTTCDVDFSPDSTRLVSAFWFNGTATIQDVATHRNVQTLSHGIYVYGAKYSPQGDRIATANPESVRVWDSNDGRLLVDVKVPVMYLSCLLWRNSHLFVKTKDNKVKQIDAATGSILSEWTVPANPADRPRIALQPHEIGRAHV